MVVWLKSSTFAAMREELEEKIRQSTLLIRHAYRHATWQDKKLEVAISGGKDSDVLIELCKMAWVWGKDGLRPLHRVTTIDPPYTIRHCMEQGVEIRRPKRDFAHCILRSGFPTMFQRHCCGELKEFAVEDYVLIGVRKSESVHRSKRYTCDQELRSYGNGGGRNMQYYPLLNWTDEDVAEFIEERKIKCHPLYYDENGNFHVERRLGCMGCPLMYYRKRIEDFKRHPKMVRFWCRWGKQYFDTHPDVKTHEYFSDVFEWFVCNTFYNDMDDYNRKWEHDRDGKTAKEFLEEYFSISLDNL